MHMALVSGLIFPWNTQEILTGDTNQGNIKEIHHTHTHTMGGFVHVMQFLLKINYMSELNIVGGMQYKR